MNSLRRIIADNLKALRDARKMPQVDLAAAAEIDRGYISSTENGRYAISSDKIEKLATALEVEPWELLHPDTAKKYKADAD